MMACLRINRDKTFIIDPKQWEAKLNTNTTSKRTPLGLSFTMNGPCFIKPWNLIIRTCYFLLILTQMSKSVRSSALLNTYCMVEINTRQYS